MRLKWYERLIGFLIFAMFIITLFNNNELLAKGITVSTFILIGMVLIRIYLTERKGDK